MESLSTHQKALIGYQIFVKELDMDIDFEVFPEGNYIQKRLKTRVNGGPFFKRIMAIFEEERSDIDILD